MNIIKTIILPATLLAVASTPALAQEPSSYLSVYGSVPIFEEEVKGFMIGAGREGAKGLYTAFDFYRYEPSASGYRLLSGSRELSGISVSSAVLTGISVPAGYAVVKKERFSLIPIGMLGSTKASACARNVCLSDVTVHYGAGVVTRIMASRRTGLHAGFRGFRVYSAWGTELTVGVTFNLSRNQ